jgi:hypothetical protein
MIDYDISLDEVFEPLEAIYVPHTFHNRAHKDLDGASAGVLLL